LQAAQQTGLGLR